MGFKFPSLKLPSPKTLIKSVSSGFNTAVRTVGQTASVVVGGATAAVGSGVGLLGGGVSQVANLGAGLGSGLGNTFAGLGSGIGGAFSGIASGVGGVIDSINPIKPIVSGVTNIFLIVGLIVGGVLLVIILRR